MSKVYVGNVHQSTTEADIENLFIKYGSINKIWVARNPPGFAFVVFDNDRDARASCAGLSGIQLHGRTLRVEQSTMQNSTPVRSGPVGRDRGMGGGYDSRSNQMGIRDMPPMDRDMGYGGRDMEYRGRDMGPGRRDFSTGGSYDGRDYAMSNRDMGYGGPRGGPLPSQRGRDPGYGRRNPIRSMRDNAYPVSNRPIVRHTPYPPPRRRSPSPPSRDAPIGHRLKGEFRILVTGMERDTTIIGFKDILGKHVAVRRVEIEDGEGEAELNTMSDIKYIIDKLDDTMIGQRYIRVKEIKPYYSRNSYRSSPARDDKSMDHDQNGSIDRNTTEGQNEHQDEREDGAADKKRAASESPQREFKREKQEEGDNASEIGSEKSDGSQPGSGQNSGENEGEEDIDEAQSAIHSEKSDNRSEKSEMSEDDADNDQDAEDSGSDQEAKMQEENSMDEENADEEEN